MDFIEITPLFVCILSLVLLYGLLTLHRKTGNWRFMSLSIIPASYFLLYFWIDAMNPPIEYARTGSRMTLLISIANALYVVFDYLAKLKRGG